MQQPTARSAHGGAVAPSAAGFNARGRAALRDPSLRDALALGTGRLRESREAAFWALPDAPDLRARAHAIKRETMAHLDRYLDMLATAVERAGGHVFFARDASEAVGYVAELAAARGVRTIVKSKSMVTEEIALNARLRERDPGLRVVETDLGEWIAQLAGDTPSHIIAPIIHMNRFQIAELLSQEAGAPIPPTVEDLMQFARRRLREQFLAADMGISGANFAVAETGTIVLVTNEGNGRLVTSLPRLHVAITGIEKLVPRFADLAVFLQLLARSGTGQPLTVYTHFITGPRHGEDSDGPEEFHLVLVDNGRAQLLGTEYEEALYCIRCGACLNVCPVYRQTGGHAYAATYSGPIGAVITPLLRGDREAQDLPYASSLCGACSEVCPVGIPLHQLLLLLRQRQVRAGLPGPAEAVAFAGFAGVMRRPAAYRAGALAGRVAQKPLRRGRALRVLPGPIGGWMGSRDLPPLADKPFRQRWKEGI